MAHSTHVHLTADATIEVRDMAGEPYLVIDPDGRQANCLYVYLGNGYGIEAAAQLHHHLDMLLTAADAAIRMAERAAEPAAGAELVEVPIEHSGRLPDVDWADGPDDDDDEDDDQVDPGEASAAAHGSTSRYLIQPCMLQRGRWDVWDDPEGIVAACRVTIAQAVERVRDLVAGDNLADQATDPQAERAAILARQAAAVEAVQYDVAHPLPEAEARLVWGDR